MNILIVLTLIAFSLGSLGRVTPFGDEVSLYLFEVLMAFTASFFFFRHRLQPFKELDKKLWPILIFLAYLAVGYLFLLGNYTIRQNVVGILYLIRLSFYFIYGIYLAYHWQKKGLSRVVRAGFIFTVVFTILSGLVQYFLYPDLRNLSYLEWDPHLYRMFGLFFDPFLSGAVYGLLILMLYFKGKELISQKYLRLLIIGVLLLIFFLTYSRGAYLAFLVTVIIYFIRQRKHFMLLVFVVAFAVSLFLLPKKAGEGMNLLRTSTIHTRWEDYNTAIQIWRRNPVFGAGYNRIRYEKVKLAKDGEVSILKSHAGASFHSSFLIILVAGGVVGLALFVYAVIQLSRVSSLLMFSTIFVSVFSLTDNVLLHPVVLFLYVVYLGWSFTLSDR